MGSGTNIDLPTGRGGPSHPARTSKGTHEAPSARGRGAQPPRPGSTPRDQLYQQVDSHRGGLARGLQGLASNLESASRSEEAGVARPLLGRAAGLLRRTSDRLENETTAELVADAQDRARERPGLVVAGLLAAGFALGRLLRR